MITGGITCATLLLMLGLWGYNFSLIPDLFKLNKECQEEGYYMGDFEFKMMGFAYYLDKGQYAKAATGINRLHKQLKSRKGLIKVPPFTDKKQEFEFYLNLQNPRTGAFMDDAFPYCTYNEVTENVLLHLEALAKQTGQPLRLKYPLKYLDDINTPDKLKVFLNEVSNIGWIASKLPQTTFVFARSILSYANGEGIMEKNDLYHFSLEWKQTLLKWFYENQDPETGFWGPRSKRNGRLLTLDLTNTASIIKAFVDNDGKNIYPSYPLRHKSEMFATALRVMSEPLPADANLDEWHEWALKMGKGSYMLTRYLWNDASGENKAKAKKLFENLVKIRFDKYYIPSEGAFAYYPESRHATLDGTGSCMGGFNDLGFFSSEKQSRLWGGPKENCTELGRIDVSALTKKDFDFIGAFQNVNSLRFYLAEPDSGNYTTNVAGLFYPKATPVLDIMELVPKARYWIENTSQSMGNWTFSEQVLSRFLNIRIEAVPVLKGEIPLKEMNEILSKNKALSVVGFDVLQIPIFKKTFYLQ